MDELCTVVRFSRKTEDNTKRTNVFAMMSRPDLKGDVNMFKSVLTLHDLS